MQYSKACQKKKRINKKITRHYVAVPCATIMVSIRDNVLNLFVTILYLETYSRYSMVTNLLTICSRVYYLLCSCLLRARILRILYNHTGGTLNQIHFLCKFIIIFLHDFIYFDIGGTLHQIIGTSVLGGLLSIIFVDLYIVPTTYLVASHYIYFFYTSVLGATE